MFGGKGLKASESSAITCEGSRISNQSCSSPFLPFFPDRIRLLMPSTGRKDASHTGRVVLKSPHELIIDIGSELLKLLLRQPSEFVASVLTRVWRLCDDEKERRSQYHGSQGSIQILFTMNQVATRRIMKSNAAKTRVCFVSRYPLGLVEVSLIPKVKLNLPRSRKSFKNTLSASQWDFAIALESAAAGGPAPVEPLDEAPRSDPMEPLAFGPTVEMWEV